MRRQARGYLCRSVHPIFREFANCRGFTAGKLTDFAIHHKRELVDPWLILFKRVVRNSLISGHALVAFGREVRLVSWGALSASRFMFRKMESVRGKGSNKRTTFKKRTPSSLNFEQLESRLAMAVVINEFLAENNSGIRDFSGERHDWIELKNEGPATVNISGWYLTDDALNLTKWQIPSTPESQSLAPGEALLVYASDKNGVFSNELHTNFKLGLEGEYLGLVQANGTTVEHAFNPYPVQVADVSYGNGASTATTTNQTLVGTSSPVRVISPTGENQARDDHWRENGYDDSTWLSGTGGVGFDRNGVTPNLLPFIGRVLTVAEMDSTDATPQYSAYVRYSFNITNKDQLTSLQLALRFDDGFIAYLNNKRVARANFAEDFIYNQPQWDSYAGLQVGTSSSAGNVQRVDEADDVVLFDLTPYLSELVEGTNVLAFHVVNSRSTAVTEHRLDLLIQPELTAIRATASQTGYMVAPTPNGSNGVATAGVVADTQFSVDRGFFDAPFQLAISTITPGAIIRYTTDGSLPTSTNGMVYSGPINIATTTNIRSAAFLSGFTSTNVDTQSYIFLNDVIQQDASYATQPYATWGHDGPDSGSESGYNLDDESDWEMDPDIVNGNEASVIDALKSIPTMSVVMDWDDLFGGNPMPGTAAGVGTVAPVPQGIYIHGRSEERASSIEYINPNLGSDQFQVDAAIEIQGHSSPGRWNSDKLSFQLSFKGPYGDSKLEYPLFNGSPDGSNAATEFDGLILDAMFNYSWVHSNVAQRDYARFVTDQVVADLQNAASGGGPHGKYVHLYLNGLYWGLYNVHERPDDGYAAEYHGGEKEEYYVVKHANTDINHEYTWVEGGIAAEQSYQSLVNATRTVESNPSSAASYQAVQDILDVDAYIDYMIAHYYGGNDADWSHNNWYAERNSGVGGQWRFHAWDNEHAFPTTDNGDSIDQFEDLTYKDNTETPTEIHRNLIANQEYRLRFADRIQELMYNGGALTPAAAAAVYQARLTEIDEAIIGESARWGDNRNPTDPYTRTDFLRINSDPAGDGLSVITDFFPVRTGTVLGHFDAAGWIPSLDAPLFSQYGGEIASGYDLTLTAPGGTPVGAVIYYTLDGSDPRNPATNGVSASAITYSGPIDLVAGAQVKARIFFNNAGTANDWSPIVDKTFTLEEAMQLRIVEVNYNPPGSSDATEYFELLNIGDEPINLAGVQITEFSTGGYTFSAQTLNPGERIVVVKEQTAFAAVYPNVANLASGVFSGSLSNEGELISLRGPLGELLQSFTYGDSNIAGWPADADGEGYSLEYIGPLDGTENPSNGSPSDPFDNSANWRASLQLNGTPGTDGTAPEPDSADFDGDGDVDGRDFLLWQRGFGTTTNAEKIDGDADNDGDVNGDDLVIWQDQYATVPPLAAVNTDDSTDEETIASVFWIDSLSLESFEATEFDGESMTPEQDAAVRESAFAEFAPITVSELDFGDIAVCREDDTSMIQWKDEILEALL
jgi:hypothetical protein